ncbi:MAG: PEP-CTERM sorting domain-containing protein [Candidatus Scalindua sp.]|nr:PEP-CTERM sorting domain-containing protein [Candidatus Scalindua sp.]
MSTTGPLMISGNGLDWISVTETVGWSYDAVLAHRLANGASSKFYGYERATTTQFLGLLSDYKIDKTVYNWTSVSAEQDDYSDLFQTDFGTTVDTLHQEKTTGVLLRPVDGKWTQGSVSQLKGTDNREMNGYYDANAYTWADDDSSPVQGLWMVRNSSPVPEPATVALLGIGLVGLAGAEARRRRRKKAVDNS